MSCEIKVNLNRVISYSALVSVIVFLLMTIFISFFEKRSEEFNLLDLQESVGFQLCPEGINTKFLICEKEEGLDSIIETYNVSVQGLNHFISGCSKVIIQDGEKCLKRFSYYNGKFYEEER